MWGILIDSVASVVLIFKLLYKEDDDTTLALSSFKFGSFLSYICINLLFIDRKSKFNDIMICFIAANFFSSLNKDIINYVIF